MQHCKNEYCSSLSQRIKIDKITPTSITWVIPHPDEQCRRLFLMMYKLKVEFKKRDGNGYCFYTLKYFCNEIPEGKIMYTGEFDLPEGPGAFLEEILLPIIQNYIKDFIISFEYSHIEQFVNQVIQFNMTLPQVHHY